MLQVIEAILKNPDDNTKVRDICYIVFSSIGLNVFPSDVCYESFYFR